MNMDQVIVLTYTDRNHKTRIVSEYEFYELFVCENNRGRILNDEEDWLEIFAGDFNYVSFYQAVINGDVCSFEEISAQLNRHWSTGDDADRLNGVFGFVNAGALNYKLFTAGTFETKEPTDYKVWMFANANPGKVKTAKEIASSEKSPTRKAWLL